MNSSIHLRKLAPAAKPWVISILVALAIRVVFPYLTGEWEGWQKSDIALLILIAILVRLGIHILTVLRRGWAVVPDAYFEPASQDRTARNVILQLRMRASRLRMVASFTLFLILIALIGGLFTFGLAEQFASRAQIERSLMLEDEARFRRNEIEKITGLVEKETDPGKKADLQLRLTEAQSRLESLEKRLSRGPAATSGQSDTIYLASLLSTKIGSALMLLFLVQILVTLYRYNIRFASFCDARADALQLLTTSEQMALGTLISVLAPDKLDFGKTPATPLQSAVDLAKEISAMRAS